MRLTIYDRILIKALYCIVAGIMVLQLLGLSSLVSNLFTMTFFFTLLLWASTAMRRIKTNDLLALLIIVVAFFHVFANSWIAGSTVTFSYLKKEIMFSTSVLFLTAASKLRVDREITQFILRLNTVLAVCFVLFFFVKHNEMYVLNGYRSHYLTFRFTNPNLTALFLTCIAFLEIVQLQKKKALWKKIHHILLSVIFLIFIYLTESRSAFVAMVGFFLLLGWTMIRRKTYTGLPKWVVVLVVVFPILFVILYMIVINSSWVHQWFAFLVSEGKALTNRYEVWQSAINAFKKSPILGAYSELSRGTGTFQMHNTHLDILVSYGITVLFGVCVLLYRLICEKNKNLQAGSLMLMIGFVGTLLLGIGEAALFSGGLGIYLYIGSFLLLANPLPEGSKHEADLRQ